MKQINWIIVATIFIFLVALPLGYKFIKTDYSLIYLIVWLILLYANTYVPELLTKLKGKNDGKI